MKMSNDAKIGRVVHLNFEGSTDAAREVRHEKIHFIKSGVIVFLQCD